VIQGEPAGARPRWLDGDDLATVAAAADRLIPADDICPGAAAAGVADYIDGLLGAFLVDPPRIFAGGPFSGRHGVELGFERWLPLGRVEELAWRTRIEGSQGIAAREVNGPVIGWQEQYRAALAELGPNFVTAAPDEQDRRLGAMPAFRELLHLHTCEGMYGDPVYGGNRDGAGWQAIGFDGDVLPRGWTDAEVSLGPGPP
jgi:hypothetical protein